MEPLTMHDLTAAYALDALDAEEARAYEEHLATCAVCRESSRSCGGAAGALAFAVESPAPPRGASLADPRRGPRERPNVVPLRRAGAGRRHRRRRGRGVAAIGFGIWSVTLSRSLDRERSARQRIEKAIAQPDGIGACA